MVVRIRFGFGPLVTRRKGKNSRAAALAASLLTLIAICIGSLGVWRLAQDVSLAGNFFFSDGLLSHWQVWIGAAAIVQYLGWRLTRYANNAAAAHDVEPVMELLSESTPETASAISRATANV